MISLDHVQLNQAFYYDPETGELARKDSGKIVGHIHKAHRGKLYKRVVFNGRQVYVHRIIWAMVNGIEPEHIDHIDGDGLNNRIENLRSVSHEQNMKNQKMHNTNTTGVAGVSYRKDSGRWRARIMNNGSSINLGTFATLEQAAAARQQYASANGYHENHGRMTA
jgi:hypothetical protein